MTPDIAKLRQQLVYAHALTVGLLTYRAWLVQYHYARVCDSGPCWWTWQRMGEKTLVEARG